MANRNLDGRHKRKQEQLAAEARVPLRGLAS